MHSDIFESSVENLQLFLAEVSLLYEAVEALWSVTHCGQLTFICDASYERVSIIEID